MYTKGQVVYSKCGRDKNRPFIIYDLDDTFLYLVDGDLRKLEKPKKKKKIHVQIVNKIDYDIKQKLENNLYILNTDIKKALAKFKN